MTGPAEAEAGADVAAADAGTIVAADSLPFPLSALDAIVAV
jgi:hypothetical protein